MTAIVDILKRIRPEFDFTEGQDFIAQGMLDSFDVMTLVAELDKTFAISIEGTDIVPENLSSIGAIRTLLGKYGVRL